MVEISDKEYQKLKTRLRKLESAISEQKNAEEILKENEEKYRTIFDGVDDLIITLNTKGVFLDVNKKFEKDSKYKKEEIVGKNVLTCGIVTKRSIPTILLNMRKVIRGAPYVVFEMDGVAKDDKIFHYENRSVPIKKGGKVVGFLSVLRDITERKKVEEALKESEEMFKAIGTSAHDAIMMIDDEGKVTYWNEAAEKIFGYTSQEIVGKELYTTIVPQHYHKAYKNGFDKFKVTGQGALIGETLELTALKKDGTEFPTEMSISAVKIKDKWGAIAIIRDVSKRKWFEGELRASEKKFRTIFEKSNDMITYVDKHGKILDVNKRVEEILGYRRDEVVGKNFAKLGVIKLKDLPKIVKLFANTIKEGKAKSMVELELRHKNGSKVFVEVGTRFIRKNGKVEGVVNIFRNITERKKAEEKLHASEEKFRGLYDSLKNGVVRTNMEGHIRECNRAYVDMLGYTEEEIKQLTYQQLTPERWHEMEVDIVKNQIVKRGYSDEYEKEYVKKDGTIFPISIRVWLIEDEQGKPGGMWGIVRDITDRKKAEDELKKRLDELERFHRVAVDRELKMIELKKQIRELEKKLGERVVFE